MSDREAVFEVSIEQLIELIKLEHLFESFLYFSVCRLPDKLELLDFFNNEDFDDDLKAKEDDVFDEDTFGTVRNEDTDDVFEDFDTDFEFEDFNVDWAAAVVEGTFEVSVASSSESVDAETGEVNGLALPLSINFMISQHLSESFL